MFINYINIVNILNIQFIRCSGHCDVVTQTFRTRCFPPIWECWPWLIASWTISIGQSEIPCPKAHPLPGSIWMRKESQSKHLASCLSVGQLWGVEPAPELPTELTQSLLQLTCGWTCPFASSAPLIPLQVLLLRAPPSKLPVVVLNCFQSGCSNLLYNQRFLWVFLLPHPHQHSVLSG